MTIFTGGDQREEKKKKKCALRDRWNGMWEKKIVVQDKTKRKKKSISMREKEEKKTKKF